MLDNRSPLRHVACLVVILGLIPLLAASAAAARTDTSTRPGQAGDTKTECVYPSEHISILAQFDALMGTNVNCVMVFNDADPTWATWDAAPWFTHTYSDMNWGAWATAAGTNRQLVITQNLFPSSENSDTNVLAEGAAGDFEQYASTLATNLVNAGLGNSIIRLAHEANGTWYPDSIPDTPTGDAEWVQFWDNTVSAMRSVPGANFKFDWTVNAGYRDIPLANFYPGNQYVDIIGIDAYDAGVSSQTNRWSQLYNEADGLGAVEQFAVAHDKPLSIPEWGVNPAIDPNARGGGDDPSYVQGIANVVANDDVAYQSYFYSGEESMQLQNSPQSISAYRRAFGTAARSALSGVSPVTLTPQSRAVTGPRLIITGGPAYQSTIYTDHTRFSFTPQAGMTPSCNLDNQGWRPCSTHTSDRLTDLTAGYHTWAVTVMNTVTEAVTLRETDFLVRRAPAVARRARADHSLARSRSMTAG